MYTPRISKGSILNLEMQQSDLKRSVHAYEMLLHNGGDNPAELQDNIARLERAIGRKQSLLHEGGKQTQWTMRSL